MNYHTYAEAIGFGLLFLLAAVLILCDAYPFKGRK